MNTIMCLRELSCEKVDEAHENLRFPLT